MALPTNTGLDHITKGHNPPHKSSGGNYYSVGFNATNQVQIKKATDPASSWANVTQTSSIGTETANDCLSSVSDDTYIHIVTLGATALSLAYTRFNMSTDAYEQEIIQVADLSGMSAPATAILWCSIALRAGVTGDELVVAASGLTDADMGSSYERVDFWHGADSGTPSWTGPVAIDTAVTHDHEVQPNLALGSNDKVHVFWGKEPSTIYSSPDALRARTISTTNTLSTIRNLALSASSLGMGNALSYDDSGTQRVVTTFSFTTQYCIRSTEDGSDDINTPTSHTITTDPAEQTVDGHAIRTLVFDGTDLHVLYSGGGAGGGDADLYHSKSTDDGATWDTPTEELNAVTINFISATILDTDTIAYLYDDGGVTKYNEIDISSGFTLTADAGTYTYTGDTGTEVQYGRIMPAAAGSYSYTANTTTLTHGYIVNAEIGAYTYTGDAATLLKYTRIFPAEAGSYAYTGDAATLLEYGRIFAVDAGAYSYTPNTTNLVHGYIVSAEIGAYTYTGDAAALLKYNRIFNAEAGSYTYTGLDANLEYGRTLIADTGSYTYTGDPNAFLQYGRIMPADAGAYTYTGLDADLIYSGDGNFTLDADTGVYTYTGNTANLEYGRTLGADAGIYTYTGNAADLEYGRRLDAELGTYAYTGDAGTTVQYDRVFDAETGSYLYTGLDAGLDHGGQPEAFTLTAETGSYSYDGIAATLRYMTHNVYPPGRTTKAGKHTIVHTGHNLEEQDLMEIVEILAISGIIE